MQNYIYTVLTGVCTICGFRNSLEGGLRTYSPKIRGVPALCPSIIVKQSYRDWSTGRAMRR